MVQYIPGPEQLLAPAAQQITEGVLNFLNPHRQFQQAVQQSIARNPEIAQSFADLEATSPGLLRNMGIGLLGSIPSTPERQFEIANRQAIVGGMEAKLGAETSKNLYNADMIQRASEIVKTNPGVAFDAALRSLTGETATERATKETDYRAGELKLAGAESELPVKFAENELNLASIQETQKLLQYGPDVTLQKFRKNEYSPKQLLGIFNSPLGKALGAQIDDYNNQQRIAMMSGRGDDAFDRLRYTQAAILFRDLDNPNVTIDDVLRYQTGAMDPSDPAYAEIQTSMGTLQTGKVGGIIQGLDRDLGAALINFKNTSAKGSATKGKAGDDARALLVKQIDGILEQKSKLPGQQRFTAKYEEVERIGFNKKELVFRGPDGKVVGPDQALGTSGGTNDQTAPPSVIGDKLSPRMGGLTAKQLDGFKAELSKYPTEGEKQAQLARWKAEAPPEAWAAIAKHLGVKP